MTADDGGDPAALPGLCRLARADRRVADRAEAGRGGARVPPRRHHVRGLRRGRRDRAPDPVRHRAADHSGGRVGDARAGLEAARARAQPVPRRRLSRAEDPEGRRDSRRACARQHAVPARDGGDGRSGRHLRAHRGRRHRARRRGRVLRARGQPARAVRRVVHAREPQDDDAAVPRALRDALDPPGPALPGHAAREPARASARRARTIRRSP